MEFYIENMTCGACARRITHAIQSIDPHAEIITDPPSRHVKVTTTVKEDDIRDKLMDVGYAPR
ncbi:heavy-metal-associated domain-containing protein [Acinetobacter guillouiae]|jgi:copper chaperone|uniref:heavy-metal-associated domain-containing protein n=1 Tax=Acinetobacter guillouiae TaxID=106649 RepID=UPI0028D168F1|nr:heavy-metal-associated domain-containing protein [Acinetobacter guillouiae]